MTTVDSAERPTGHGFGTGPVFLASISTILGAIMFLRFGYAVGNVGLLGAFGIILLGHLVTVPTALAIAEIATNRRVEGGGEYFIISRSFGTTIGGAIGVSLYISQAVSVAFYMIAFGEAFTPLAPWILESFGLVYDARCRLLAEAQGRIEARLHQSRRVKRTGIPRMCAPQNRPFAPRQCEADEKHCRRTAYLVHATEDQRFSQRLVGFGAAKRESTHGTGAGGFDGAQARTQGSHVGCPVHCPSPV